MEQTLPALATLTLGPPCTWDDFHGPHSPEGGDSGAGLPLSLSLAVSDLL